jgi:type I restriction enzyme S subunit
MYRGEIHGPLIHGMNLLRARLNYPSLTPLFVEKYLNTSEARRHFRSVTKKAVNQASISSTDIKSIKLPIPPLALQREFAAFVEKVDKLRENMRATVAKMDMLYRSRLQEYFG